jgi:hypothetical protein
MHRQSLLPKLLHSTHPLLSAIKILVNCSTTTTTTSINNNYNNHNNNNLNLTIRLLSETAIVDGTRAPRVNVEFELKKAVVVKLPSNDSDNDDDDDNKVVVVDDTIFVVVGNVAGRHAMLKNCRKLQSITISISIIPSS